MNRLFYAVVALLILFFVSCASSKCVMSEASKISLDMYKYAVYGIIDDEGDAELADLLVMVQNELSNNLSVISSSQAIDLISRGEYVLSPRINIKSEKWDGGHTYISVIFYDYKTNQSIAVVKSSGIGLSISQDKKLAYKALKKELNKIFLSKEN